MSCYFDASVLMPTLVSEPATTAVLEFLARAREPLLVSDFAAAEVASGVSKLVRMGDMSADDGRGTLARFDVWRRAATEPMEIDNPDIVAAGALVRRFELKLRTPDALHLVVSQRAGAKLLTYDGTLITAAAASGVVTIQP